MQNKQPIVFDSITLPTLDYYNTRYAADNIQLPITGYFVAIWALVVRLML